VNRIDDVLTLRPLEARTCAIRALQFNLERRRGSVNWLGLWTLYRREVRRILKVAAQTVIVLSSA
jgi:hypothetical protein